MIVHKPTCSRGQGNSIPSSRGYLRSRGLLLAFRNAAGVIREYVSREQCLKVSDRQQSISDLPSDPGLPSDVLLLVPAPMTRLYLGKGSVVSCVTELFNRQEALDAYVTKESMHCTGAHREQDHSDKRQYSLIENSSLKAINERKCGKSLPHLT